MRPARVKPCSPLLALAAGSRGPEVRLDIVVGGLLQGHRAVDLVSGKKDQEALQANESDEPNRKKREDVSNVGLPLICGPKSTRIAVPPSVDASAVLRCRLRSMPGSSSLFGALLYIDP